MVRRTVLVAGLGALLALGGCTEGKEGSGVEASETRRMDPFTGISLDAEADVVVTVGNEQKVTVRGDDNLIGDVETAVDNDTLEISQPDEVDLNPKVGMVVEISMPSLVAVELGGAGDMTIDGIDGDSFRAEVSGAGNIEATGSVDRVEAEVSGAGELNLARLVARDATADVSGAGDIRVHATESLAASVSGAGDIVYTGEPADVDTDISGVGDIRAD